MPTCAYIIIHNHMHLNTYKHTCTVSRSETRGSHSGDFSPPLNPYPWGIPQATDSPLIPAQTLCTCVLSPSHTYTHRHMPAHTVHALVYTKISSLLDGCCATPVLSVPVSAVRSSCRQNKEGRGGCVPAGLGLASAASVEQCHLGSRGKKSNAEQKQGHCEQRKF